jgi:hypothetical protein
MHSIKLSNSDEMRKRPNESLFWAQLFATWKKKSTIRIKDFCEKEVPKLPNFKVDIFRQ